MQEHRIYYLSEHGRIVGVDDVSPVDEAEARARAETLIGDHFGIEIWRGAERVAQLKNETRLQGDGGGASNRMTSSGGCQAGGSGGGGGSAPQA